MSERPPLPLSQRAAAILFAFGAATFIATITMYVSVYGAPEGTGADAAITVADSASHLLEKRGLIRAIWLSETLAVCAHAMAAFILISRGGREYSLAPLGWSAIGVGSTVYVCLYAVMLGAYWPAAEVAQTDPALLDSANQTAIAFFLIANIPINLGLALVFIAEATGDQPAIPRPVSWVAAACGILLAVVNLYAIASEGGMATALTFAPAGGLLFLISSVFGLRLAFRASSSLRETA